MKIRLLIVVACMLAAFTPASANHGCNQDVITIAAGTETIYVDQRGDEPTGNWWYYLESNGWEGLQSGGEQIVGLWSDSCVHANPDMLLY